MTYGVDSAVLLNAEIEINSHDHTLTTQQPAPAGAFDLQTILTHEAGHFLGLAHATSETSVMYAFYAQDARELTPDDVAGLCAAYPPTVGTAGLSCRLRPREVRRAARRAWAPRSSGSVWARRRRCRRR